MFSKAKKNQIKRNLNSKSILIKVAQLSTNAITGQSVCRDVLWLVERFSFAQKILMGLQINWIKRDNG